MTVGVAAVLAVLLCIVAVAFAVDQEFRAAVLSFFHISAEDHVERVPVEDQPSQAMTRLGKYHRHKSACSQQRSRRKWVICDLLR